MHLYIIIVYYCSLCLFSWRFSRRKSRLKSWLFVSVFFATSEVTKRVLPKVLQDFRALKDVLNVIVEPLCYLVNTFIQEGKFPNHLKQAFVVAIFKKGDPENANNYRPISKTSALAKLFEKILRQQINEYLTENN